MNARRLAAKLIPALEWLPAYDRASLRPDFVAGLTTAAVVLPKAMAYATLAGLPLQVGLYTALVPTAVYAILGSSRRLSMSTTTTLAAAIHGTGLRRVRKRRSTARVGRPER